TNHLYKTWGTLTEAVRKGGTVYEKNINERGPQWLEAFIASMHYRGMKQSKILAMMLELDNVKKMLDIGGGSGAFSIGFMNVNKNIRSTILDLTNVIPLSKRYVEKEKLIDKFEFIEGDYHTSDLGSGYDLILLSAIAHINSFDENKQLIKKCADALNPGGQVVVLDQIMNDDRTSPVNGAMFAINMLVGTECGDTYTESEICSWLTDAGLSCIEKKDTSFDSALMLGKKI
ncbi:methyltransferase, partial [Bacteroidota bacterium]